MNLEVTSRYRQSHSLKSERQEYREKLFNLKKMKKILKKIVENILKKEE